MSTSTITHILSSCPNIDRKGRQLKLHYSSMTKLLIMFLRMLICKSLKLRIQFDSEIRKDLKVKKKGFVHQERNFFFGKI